MQVRDRTRAVGVGTKVLTCKGRTIRYEAARYDAARHDTMDDAIGSFLEEVRDPTAAAASSYGKQHPDGWDVDYSNGSIRVGVG